MKEPLGLKLLDLFEPQKKAPVRGVVFRRGGHGPLLNLPSSAVKLSGSDYRLDLPWGVGISYKDSGIWHTVLPELRGNLRGKHGNIEMLIPAHFDLKLNYRNGWCEVHLDRDYSQVNLSERWSSLRKHLLSYCKWALWALLAHILLYLIIMYLPVGPLKFLERKIVGSPSDTKSLETLIIEQAKKDSKISMSERDTVKVKFSFFNGVPWDQNRKTSENETSALRLDRLLKDLKGKDLSFEFNSKGVATREDFKKSLPANGMNREGPKLSQMLKQQGTSQKKTPLQPTSDSLQRDLSAAELKLIRSRMQSVLPELTLSYQRALARNPQLAFGLRYEATIDPSGHLRHVKFKTSGVQGEDALPTLLDELRAIFERTFISKDLSGVTIQGENLFKSQ